MSDGYETLVNMAKPFLNNSKQITENDITDAVNTVSVMLKKRYDMTDEDIRKAVSELLHFYAVTMTDDDAELFKPMIRSTWWTDSAETRKKEGRNYYWDSYKQYLMEKDKLPADVIERIDERSDKVMNYLFDPTNPDIKDAITPLENLFEDMLESNWASSPKFDTPEFDKMLPELPSIISSVTVGMSNTSEATIKYSSEHQTNIIAIGGNSLARGFTIENLSVSYFLRNTKMCDTLLQMGRWFGYRRDYEDLCKIYTTEKYYNNFHDALTATNSLVNCVKSMEKAGKTPMEFLVTVSQHPATRMILTARNKMYNAENDKGVFLDGTIREKGTYEYTEVTEIIASEKTWYPSPFMMISKNMRIHCL